MRIHADVVAEVTNAGARAGSAAAAAEQFWVYIVHPERKCAMTKRREESSAKESRLSIRVDAARKAVIARAAKQRGETLSDFVLENAYQVAAALLADEAPVSLTRKQLAHIFETLDNPPPTSVAAVRKLLTERSILDG
ncbi:MAG: DUF1778 domain-containing protein [Planctomycetia bacterium]